MKTLITLLFFAFFTHCLSGQPQISRIIFQIVDQSNQLKNYSATVKMKKLSKLIIVILLLLIGFSHNMVAQEKTGQINCSNLDSIETLENKIIDEVPAMIIHEEFKYGVKNKNLSEKAKLNGDTDIETILDQLYVAEVGEEKFRNDQFKIFDINFFINENDEIENLFFTHEYFWYSKEEGKKSQFERLNKNDPAEMEMAKSMMGFMEYEEIEMLKKVITSQKWETGKCDGKKVSTLIYITLNDLKPEDVKR